MAIKVKAVERLIKFNKNDAGTYRYVMAPETYSSTALKRKVNPCNCTWLKIQPSSILSRVRITWHNHGLGKSAEWKLGNLNLNAFV